MLKKENRLLNRFEYNITKKYGTYSAGKYFHIYMLKPRNYAGPTQYGFVVSNKFHKHATIRNRVKRLYREVVQKSVAKFGNDRWIVIYPKFSSLGKTYEEINTDFNKTIQKVSFS